MTEKEEALDRMVGCHHDWIPFMFKQSAAGLITTVVACTKCGEKHRMGEHGIEEKIAEFSVTYNVGPQYTGVILR